MHYSNHHVQTFLAHDGQGILQIKISILLAWILKYTCIYPNLSEALRVSNSIHNGYNGSFWCSYTSLHGKEGL